MNMTRGNKTIMCKNHVRNGYCKYSNCGFAHGFNQLRIKSCGKGEVCPHISYDLDTGNYYNLEMHDYVCKRIHPEESKDNFYRRVGYNNIKNVEKTKKDYNLKELSLKIDYITNRIDEMYKMFKFITATLNEEQEGYDEEEKEDYPPTAPSSPVKKVSFKLEESKEDKEDKEYEENKEDEEYETDCSFIEKDEDDDEGSYVPSEDDESILYEEDNYIDDYVVLSEEEKEE